MKLRNKIFIGVATCFVVAISALAITDGVIDYTKQNFTEGKEKYDLVFDTAGNHATLDLLGVLKPEGTLVGIGGSVIDRRYSLEKTAAALEYIGTRRARGKVIVTLD